MRLSGTRPGKHIDISPQRRFVDGLLLIGEQFLLLLQRSVSQERHNFFVLGGILHDESHVVLERRTLKIPLDECIVVLTVKPTECSHRRQSDDPHRGHLLESLQDRIVILSFLRRCRNWILCAWRTVCFNAKREQALCLDVAHRGKKTHKRREVIEPLVHEPTLRH